MRAWRNGMPIRRRNRWPPRRRSPAPERRLRPSARGIRAPAAGPSSRATPAPSGRTRSNRGARNTRARIRNATWRGAARTARASLPSGPTIDHLARLDVVHVDSADQVERAGFRREHVTDATAGSSSWPMASGRNPCGSRATMMRFSARRTSEYAPSSCSKASRRAEPSVRSREWATRCSMTSVSLEA